MNYRKTLLAASIITSLCVSGVAFAQDAQSTGNTTSTTRQKDKDATQLGTVTVVGIRDSEAESLNLKKAAASHVEIVTAEDIGKLPAKNVADTLQRLPGVNISSSSAAEGGFDENDRVSLRGTNPSLTQTLVNGHTVGTGDWFVLSQVQTVGRSVSYSLLPSEIVSQVVVHKTSEAKIVEGGAAGSVDIISRKPLEFAKNITAEASIGGVYSDLPSNTKPQFSGMFNWKNDSNTVGLLVQGFYEKRSLQRNGQEVVGGYQQITAASAPNTVAAHPELAGMYYPNEIGAVLFTQTRERKGGVVDLQFKPTENLTLDLNGFYSKLKADNYNRNYMMWASSALGGAGGGVLTPGAVNNNVVTNGTISGGTNAYGVYDQISRPGAASESKFLTLDANWRVSDHLTLKGQVGSTRGTGSSPTQDVIELGTAGGAGASWDMRGTGKPINWTLGGDNASPSGILPGSGWIFGGQGIKVTDKEKWGQLDGELAFDDGAFSSLEFGVRYADHTRENPFEVAQGPNWATDWTNPALYPTSHQNYPGDFGNSVGGSFPGNIWYYTPGQLAQIDSQFANRDPVGRFYFNDIYRVKEKDTAAYLQMNFETGAVAGNFGVRYVQTKENIGYSSTAPDGDANTVEGPITGSAFGDYYWNTYKKTHSKFLPSANLRYSINDDLLLRVAASQTMTRPDYSALAGYVSADDLTHTGSGGNPKLDPLISSNFDASLEWYFAPRGLLSAGVYAMNLKDYINFGNETRTFKDMQASQAAGHDVFNDYLISVPRNVNGQVRGVELNYIQPVGEHFGVQGNYTYADGHATGDEPLQGTSKNTYNVSGYFENKLLNARVSYTYRSEFYAGVSRTDTYFQQGIGSLSASLGVNLTDWMSLSLDAMNLNNPKLKYYTKNDAYGKQPYAFYVNGRQYYLNLRFKL
ncbi:TonB-dependent receptor [Rhodanobacter sp. Root561]|uniref:TonB-dependent receptor n=1 Tax=Rhodanobacter sp. Root561 TaxID=1736560 RepID=UPI0006F66C40|nr:TonB-dependent receptor [Rhodanobacter sp. Root561]KQZ79361.1 TonB-dependent receptor [Rhodanobacter sp. Root561]